MKTMIIDEDIFRAYLSAIRQASLDVREMRNELEAIGAIRTETGDYLYPFYMDGGERYLPRDTWIQARKDIGQHIKNLP